MRPWWPENLREAWMDLRPRDRARAADLLSELVGAQGGMIVGQTRLLDAVGRKHGVPYSSAWRVLDALVRSGIVRRRYAGRRLVIWVPEHLMEPVPGFEEELLAGVRREGAE